MSVPLPQFKTRKLTTKDFVTNIIDEGYDANGVVLGSVADFYNVSEKEKEILFALEKGFHAVSQNMIKKEISVPEYLSEIAKLNDLTKKLPNIKIELNDNKVFVIFLESELKPEYQTKEQLSEQKAKPSKPTIFALYGIEWEESERGWGTRPDGFSFHRSMEESETYLKDFLARQPRDVPDEYSRLLGKARLIEVSQGLHDYVVDNGSVWLVPKSESAYKTYDAGHLTKPKNKM